MNYLKVSVGIFLILAVSRFVPHPPNFTSLIALSFYVPVLLGLRYLSALIISFAITDILIGYHLWTFFTWGSVFLIGLIANYFAKNIQTRLSGALLGAIIFFILSNFGVWTSGMYGYSLKGLVDCFILAIPFFAYTAISTIVFSIIFEIMYKISKIKKLKIIHN